MTPCRRISISIAAKPPDRTTRKDGVGKTRSVSACRKSLAEFAPAGANRVLIIFSGDMCVGENTFRLANVRAKRVRCGEPHPLKRTPQRSGVRLKKKPPVHILWTGCGCYAVIGVSFRRGVRRRDRSSRRSRRSRGPSRRRAACPYARAGAICRSCGSARAG